MKISKEGLNLIKKFEGFSSKPYSDPVGIPTIGYGTTRYSSGKKVKMSDNYVCREKAEEILREQVDNIYSKAVNKYAKNIQTQQQFDALVSFTYNLGVGSLKKSTLLKKHNKSDYLGASKEFERWVYAGGIVLKGLRRRREAERTMYLS